VGVGNQSLIILILFFFAFSAFLRGFRPSEFFATSLPRFRGAQLAFGPVVPFRAFSGDSEFQVPKFFSANPFSRSGIFCALCAFLRQFPFRLRRRWNCALQTEIISS
jgi:hypothetical protein